MKILERNTVENLFILLASVLLFNGLVYLPVIGNYIKQYPYIMIGAAVLLLVVKDKAANLIGGR